LIGVAVVKDDGFLGEVAWGVGELSVTIELVEEFDVDRKLLLDSGKSRASLLPSAWVIRSQVIVL
jgi:hypothetical protein